MTTDVSIIAGMSPPTNTQTDRHIMRCLVLRFVFGHLPPFPTRGHCSLRQKTKGSLQLMNRTPVGETAVGDLEFSSQSRRYADARDQSRVV